MHIVHRKRNVDAERHRLTPRTLTISVKTICVRMWDCVKPIQCATPGTTLASATLAQKTIDKSSPKHYNIIEINPKIDEKSSLSFLERCWWVQGSFWRPLFTAMLQANDFREKSRSYLGNAFFRLQIFVAKKTNTDTRLTIFA